MSSKVILLLYTGLVCISVNFAVPVELGVILSNENYIYGSRTVSCLGISA